MLDKTITLDWKGWDLVINHVKDIRSDIRDEDERTQLVQLDGGEEGTSKTMTLVLSKNGVGFFPGNIQEWKERGKE